MASARRCACCRRRFFSERLRESREKTGLRHQERKRPCLGEESSQFRQSDKSPSDCRGLHQGKCGEEAEVLPHRETQGRKKPHGRTQSRGAPIAEACGCVENSCRKSGQHTESPVGLLSRQAEERSGGLLEDRGFRDTNGKNERSGDLSLTDSLCKCCDRPPLCCGCVVLPPAPPPLPSPFVIVQRLRKLYRIGPVSGKIFCILAIMTWAYVRILEFFFPRCVFARQC